jgi:excinuclease ABC subunit C
MKDFKRVMMGVAQNMHFEEAQDKRKSKCLKLSIALHYRKSKITNIDVFSIVSDESAAYVNFFANFTFDYSISYHGNQEETGNRC